MGGRKFARTIKALAPCVSSVITLPVLFLVLLLAFGHLSHAQGIGNERHATGLILMTPQESEAFRRTHNEVKGAQPNAIALERINNARAKKGLTPLPEELAASPGRELVFSEGGDVSGAEDLPVWVDNSTMQCFPPIGDQNGLGSCTTFATTYYQLTYMVGLIMHPEWVQPDLPDPPNYSIIFSPRWTFNFQRDSENDGSSFWGNYEVLQHNGACTWAEFPYDGVDYKSWCVDPDAWEHAIHYRINPISYILDDDLAGMKEALNSGYLITFGTYVHNWQYTTIEDNPYSTDDNSEVGKSIAYWVNGTRGGHAMTIVGYNDAIWTDVNNSGDIDEGELGAFRIANSWGTDSTSPSASDGGYTWLAYDALKETSDIKKAPRGRRIAAFPEGHVYIMTMKDDYIPDTPYAPYIPKLLAKLTLDHVKRNQLILHLGISETTESSPSITWYPGVFNLRSGEYAFDGGSGPYPATFYLDFTDILLSGSMERRYYLGVFDSTTGDPAILSDFALKEISTGVEYGGVNPPSLPYTVDRGENYASIDYNFDSGTINQPPRAKIWVSTTSGSPPLFVQFDALHIGDPSYDPEGSELKYVWNFGCIQSSPIGVGEIIADPAYTYEDRGTYCAKLTVTDDMGASSSAVVLIFVGTEPTDTTSPVAVTDLSASSPTSSSISLTWTAPGDDGDTGTASQYDIRYSTTEVTDSNWGTATQCNGEPSPSPAGATESFTVGGLLPSTTYHFALKTADEVSNWSGLSNSPSGTTGEGAPQIMHVSAIDMLLKEAGPNVNAIATATIVDDLGTPVSGATVSGKWSGATSDTDSGVTDDGGQVALQSDKVRNPDTAFTFTVGNVEKGGWTYDPDANAETSDSISVSSTAPALSAATGLENAYPSPSNPDVWIPFTLSDTRYAVIRIYSLTGRLVRTLDLGNKPAGAYITREKAGYWDGRNEAGEYVSSGVYFYTVQVGDFTATKKMLIAK